MKRIVRIFAASCMCLAAPACEIPTETPSLDQRWIIPVETTQLGVNELLPSGVTISGGNFDAQVDDFALSETLGDLCGICVNGVTVPSVGGRPNWLPARTCIGPSSGVLPLKSIERISVWTVR